MATDGYGWLLLATDSYCQLLEAKLLFYRAIECLLCRQAQKLGTIDEVRDRTTGKDTDRQGQRDGQYLPNIYMLIT